MERNEFDDIIKEKLEHPTELEDQRAWDLFMLSAIEKGEEEIFEDRSADQLAQSALQDYKVDFDASSWDVLAKKMEEQTAEEPTIINARFDKEVSNSLQGLKRKYDSATWPRLAARLEAEERYLSHYYRAKFIEAVLFIFLVLTLFQFGESEKIKLKQKSEHAPIEQLLAPAQAPVASGDEPARNFSGNKDQVVATSRSATNSMIKTDLDLFQAGLATETTQGSPSTFGNTNNGTDLDVSQRNIASVDRGLISFASLPARTFERQHNLVIRPEANTNLRKSTDELEIISAGVDEINTIANLALPAVRKVGLPGGWKIGMYAHMDVNQITLPQQSLIVYSKKTTYYAQNIQSLGYGSGFKALYVKNKIGFEVGLGYTNKSYAPKNRTISGDKFFNVKFANIEYQILDIPMNFRYGSTKNTRFKTYAQVGFNTNFITKAIHDVIPESLFATIDSRSISPDQEAIVSTVKGQFTKFDKKRVLLYAQGAVGAEWRASNTLDIYSQITYGQRLLNKQFGPSYDQFKSLSMEMGIRTKL